MQQIFHWYHEFTKKMIFGVLFKFVCIFARVQYQDMLAKITIKITLISFRNIMYSNRPDGLSLLAEDWASIRKVVGSI